MSEEFKQIKDANVAVFKFPPKAADYFTRSYLDEAYGGYLMVMGGEDFVTNKIPAVAYSHELGKHLPHMANFMITGLMESLKIDSEKEDAQKMLDLIKEMRFGKKRADMPAFVIEGFPRDFPDFFLALGHPTEEPPYYAYEKPTPKDPHKMNAQEDIYARGRGTDVAEAAMATFMVLIGGQMPQRLKALHQGAGFQHITNRSGHEEEKNSSYGGGVHEWHAEGSSFGNDHAIEYLFLYCMENKHTQTTMMPTKDIARIFNDNLSPEELYLLSQPIFKFVPSSAYSKSGHLSNSDFFDSKPSPILFLKEPMQVGDNLDPQNIQRIRFDYDMKVHELCPQRLKGIAEKLGAKIQRILDANSMAITLHPGQLAVLRNNIMMHGKSMTHPDDMEDRWLIRARTSINRNINNELAREVEKYQPASQDGFYSTNHPVDSIEAADKYLKDLLNLKKPENKRYYSGKGFGGLDY